MKIETSSITKLLISDVPRLDPITVLLEDFGSNQGKLIVECYGRSWSAYWGGMGSTLVPFLKSVSTDYVASRMYHGEFEVYDPEGTKTLLKNEVLRQRRKWEIGQTHARDLWEEIEMTHFEDFHALEGTSLTFDVLGDDWRSVVATKTHPDFTYLTRIIEAVRAGVAEAFTEKPDEK